MKKYLWSTVLLGAFLTTGCQSQSVEEESLPIEGTTEQTGAVADYPTIGLPTYPTEIVDELYNTDSEVQEWVDSLKHEKGVYVRSSEDSDLVLLAAGKQTLTGFGMAFVDARRSDEGVYVVYSLIEPSEDSIEAGQVIEQETYPFMLLKLPKQPGKILPYYLEEAKIGAFIMAHTDFSESTSSESSESADPLANGESE